MRSGRMRLLVAAGSAEELPGLLDWLEWGGIDLTICAAIERAAGGSPPCRPPGRSGSAGGRRLAAASRAGT